MTPRQEDVAFVLEGVAGVHEVYARTEPGSRFDFAVRVDGPRSLAAAHYALRRVLSYEELERVLVFTTQLPGGVAPRVVRIVLSPSERAAARERDAARPPPEPVTVPTPKRAGFSALIVDPDVEVYRAVVTAFGPDGERLVEPSPIRAVAAVRTLGFGLILCAARRAFGRGGFFSLLDAVDRYLVPTVILTAAGGEVDLVRASMFETRCRNTCLVKPIDPAALVEFARFGCAKMPFSIPLPPVRPEPAFPSPAREVRSVLIVDDDLRTEHLVDALAGDELKVCHTTDAWEALEQLETAAPDVVLCSATMVTGEMHLYRLLWAAHPELKRRFILIVPRDAVPASGRLRPMVERPLTPASVTEVLARFGTMA